MINPITEFVNPGPIPVMACDFSIFAKAKFMQWTWSEIHGEDKFVVMFVMFEGLYL